ncbi:acetyltransferase [Arthrobacter crystallopoietes BAB-32]|uniref:Acetyltransferase n=1 Tax=Arthrobacter crystallopoietes BAB-32 TaxID=1246476 RepID=N1V917_9MICC|nr:GNAT family N-acetyltransferase [Arthrobacter crystallopoietes]EMY34748.1 acetyltransferase [Arthrobacter crystallopoietes BAB-32]
MAPAADGNDRDLETTLQTARLLLNRPRAEDADTVFRILSDRRTTRHNPSDALNWREEAEGLFQRWEEQWDRHGVGYFAVRLPDRAEPIGFAGVKHVLFDGRPVLNLYCRLDYRFWGRGYGTEAVRAVVAHANELLELPPVIARVRPGNAASARIVRAAGFEPAPELGLEGPDGYEDIYVLNWSRNL